MSSIDRVTSNPPSDEQEPRWEQPEFLPDPEPREATPVTGHVIVPGETARVPPPSALENVIGALAKVVWPVAILMIVFTRASFWPLLISAIVLGTVLSALKQNMRQRRRANSIYLPPAPGPDQR